MKFIKQRCNKIERGFTIVELMIATTILSVILLLVTSVIINIVNTFYKGFNQARLQTDARSISNDVSQHLKLSDGGLMVLGPQSVNVNGSSVTEMGYCISNAQSDTRYTYVLRTQVGNNSTPSNPQVPYVLWRDTVPVCDGSVADFASASNPSAIGILPGGSPLGATGTDGAELIAPTSRLSDFSISGNGIYTVSLYVAFGGDDLFNNPVAPNPQCLGDNGNHFCATASLQTTVAKRPQ